MIVVSRVPTSLRGRLTRWLLQLKAGVFVGTLTPRVRDRLWQAVCDSIKRGWAVMLFAAPTEQGFDLRTHGTAPVEFEDFEGLWLAKKQFTR